MAFFPERTVEEIRARIDIVELIGAHIRLKRAGQNFLACCPFHKEKTPSFNVSPSRQRYHCFGCGEGGDCFTFLMKHTGMTFVDAIKHLAERCGVTLETEEDDGTSRLLKSLQSLHADLAGFYQRCLRDTAAAEPARKYLEERNLSEAVDLFQIGYAPHRWDALEMWSRHNKVDIGLLENAGLVKRSSRARSASGVYDRFRDRLMFPICDVQARVIAFSGRILHPDDRAAKYVNSPETPLFHKSRVLYGLDKARRNIVSVTNREAVVCEGQIDVIRCHMNGINTAVAAQGTAFTEQHVALLKRYADTAVLVFDQDAAGLKAAIRTARLFLSVGMPVRVARLSAGEDPDSFLLKHGADPFRELISNACSPVRFEVDTLRNVEHDPDSVDAIGRISSSVIETLAGCSNAIFRAHLIQEAADALNLPENALTSELERFEEKLAAREAKRESFAAAAKPVSDTLDTFLHTKEPPNETPDSDMDLVEEWQNDAVEPVIDSLPKELIESAQEIPPVADKDVSLTEKLLCECLVHWIDNSQIVKLVIDNIPVSILEHTFSQAILSAIIETCNSGTDGLTQLRTTAPAPLQQFVCELETMPSKMFGQEFRPEEAVHDAILGVWRAYLQRKRTSLNISDPEALQRRQRISVLLRQLRNWEMGEHVIAVEISAMNVADPHIS